MSQDSSESVGTMEEEEEIGRPPFRFTQWFKKMAVEDSLPESDMLSALAFSGDGKYLASGDRGGRVVVLKADDVSAISKENDKEKENKLHYKFFCEFQSHEPTYDFVRSLAIDERINAISFLPETAGSVRLMTANDRVVKLWSLKEIETRFTSNFNLSENDVDGSSGPKRWSQVRFPKSETIDSLVTALPKREFAEDIHKFNVHSLCPSSDGETFITADNLVLNQWHMDRTKVAFQIVNLRPVDMTKLTEYITCAELEPEESNLFMYATNKGAVRVGDLRDKAVNDIPSLEFLDPSFDSLDKKGQGQNPPSFPQRPFLSDMLRTVNDVKFMKGSKYVVARDYMNVKVWDMAMPDKPVELIQVHEYLQSSLWSLYENEFLYDVFDVAVNKRGEIVTGSYNNYFHVYDLDQRTDIMIEASKPPMPVMPIMDPVPEIQKDQRKSVKKKRNSGKPGLVSLLSRKKKKDGKGGFGDASPFDVDPSNINFDKRIQQLAWHPDGDAVAVAGENNLFLYSR